jgi:putative DNA primase/helicase
MIAEHETVRLIQEEARAIADSGIRGEDEGGRDYVYAIVRKQAVMFSERLAQWGRESESAAKLGALSKRGEPYFAIQLEKLDADRYAFNVNNGTLVIRRAKEGEYVTFKPHDPADLITKLAPVDYLPAAPCAEYDRFLERVLPDQAMRDFVHQWFGLSLTGDVSEQKLAFFYGKGGNGKSVLTDTISYIVGDYGETVPIETFLDHGRSRTGGQATPDLAILPGVRMLRTSEPEKNAKLAEAMVKLVTGGEPILARHLNRDFFRFYPQFKMTFGGNYRPQISGADEGIWRRVRLVPFNVTIPKEERDPHLAEKLRGEASGILNRLLDGLCVWLDKGLQEPEGVLAATAEYRSSSDPLGRFLGACVALSPGERVQSSTMHAVYEAWCAASGETAWKQKGFSQAMEERGFKRKQSDVMWFLDVKLLKGVNDFVDHEGKPLKMSDVETRQESSDATDIEV